MVNTNISLDEIVRIDLRYQRNEIGGKVENPYYPNENRVKEYVPDKERDVSEANNYQFGNDVNGTTFGVTFTYGGGIIILDTLKGPDRDKVLKHELHHRNNPMDSEYMTRKKTDTEEFEPNKTISPVGAY